MFRAAAASHSGVKRIVAVNNLLQKLVRREPVTSEDQEALFDMVTSPKPRSRQEQDQLQGDALRMVFAVVNGVWRQHDASEVVTCLHHELEEASSPSSPPFTHIFVRAPDYQCC